MKIYVVCVQNIVSQKAYSEYNKAKTFIKNRSDKPAMINPFMFKSKLNKYTIHEVVVKLI